MDGRDAAEGVDGKEAREAVDGDDTELRLLEGDEPGAEGEEAERLLEEGEEGADATEGAVGADATEGADGVEGPEPAQAVTGTMELESSTPLATARDVSNCLLFMIVLLKCMRMKDLNGISPDSHFSLRCTMNYSHKPSYHP